MNVELLKVEETCKMAISNQASKDEGVETRRAASKGSPSYDEGIVQRTNTPNGSGSENYSVMNLEVAGSSPAEITNLF